MTTQHGCDAVLRSACVQGHTCGDFVVVVAGATVPKVSDSAGMG